MSSTPRPLSLVGVYLGILGIIVAAGSPELSRAGVNAIAVAFLLWVFGLVFILASFAEPTQPA